MEYCTENLQEVRKFW